MVSRTLFAGLVLALVTPVAQASLNVFACEPEWGDLARSLAPEADITVATTAWQDPHYVEARPSLIAAVRRADLVVCTGASLEVGWLPALLQKSANREVQEGEPGLFYAAEQVPLHQPHDHVDRSMGDVHPEGDPHVHLDPEAMPVIAEALASRMGQLAPESTSDIQRRYLSWRVDWNLRRDQWREAAQRLEGRELVVQHTSFNYLLRWLGVEPVIDLEPKPGLPPSASHLSKVLANDRLDQADGILVATYQDDRPAQWLSKQSALPVLVLPATVTGEAPTQTLPDLIDHIIRQLGNLSNDT
ncbi:metal ABC transporter substrate-binding protein [Marinobacter sp. OP 3.4]|uniref:metal ABC transporter substrate-binding protein n=1 Tax=Marinobacter sp. OP 3.4 TaxID=3076501 RepID=UPI002E1B733D